MSGFLTKLHGVKTELLDHGVTIIFGQGYGYSTVGVGASYH